MCDSKTTFFLFTCVKNGRSYINKLFDSLLNQTKKNFIHYIYEDGSDEPLDELVNDYIKQVNSLDSPYQVIYEKCETNIGLNKATEHCLKKCNLNYFIWMNCDDWLDYNFFENAEKYIKKHPNYAIYRSTMISHIGSETKQMPKSKNEIKIFKKTQQIYPCLSYQFTFNHFIGNFKLLKEINPELFLIKNKLIFNDVQICLPFIFCKYKIGFLADCTSHFLYRDGSEYNSSNKKFITKCNDEDYFKPFTNYFEIYQKVLSFGNDFLIYVRDRKYKDAVDILNKRKKYLKKHHYKNNKALISNHNPFVWNIYCKLKLLKCRWHK